MGFEYSYLQLESKWMIQRFWAILPQSISRNHPPKEVSWNWSNSWSQAFGGLERPWCPGPRKHMYPSLPVSLISGLISLQHDQILVILVVFLPVAMFQHVPVDINYTSTSSDLVFKTSRWFGNKYWTWLTIFKNKNEMTCTTYPAPSFICSIARLLDPSWTSMVNYRGWSPHGLPSYHSLCNDPADQADRYFAR